ncbi:MAG TPA: DUF1508 domain-containing protein [Phycisphaerales bacterium]|nr:DUF1508 domain-containing protein [Phycisphaerales bacterium]
MANGRFLISRDATGAFRWVLRDDAGGTVSESTEGFIEHRACVASLERLRKLAAKAEVIDLTMPAKVIKPSGGGGGSGKSGKAASANRPASRPAAGSAPKKKGKR